MKRTLLVECGYGGRGCNISGRLDSNSYLSNAVRRERAGTRHPTTTTLPACLEAERRAKGVKEKC
jgi:hypothetical protein